jgi:KUP system potassium uptake protein
MPANGQESRHNSLATLALGAVGVVYGDIGTSPLYTIKECFHGPHPLTPDPQHILGVLSLAFWSVMLVVSIKYAVFMMRADNRGEGGSLALLALITQITRDSRLFFLVAVLGIFAAALFYGDSMLTPAISVLSAVEGLQVAAPALAQAVVPLTILILAGLFLIQRKGTAAVGVLFGPVMVLWFAILALLGGLAIVRAPSVLAALNPVHAFHFFALDGWQAFLTLGSVVLALTGAEALYADMGHFGKQPIRLAWFALVLPALLLNYFGQGALLMQNPDAKTNPFFLMVPDWALLPMVGLATLATVIASQAVISGAFSVTRQAIQLGYLPRMDIRHTSRHEIGQIYIPFVNWLLFAAVVGLVLGFRSSSNLAAAYGVAVTGTMTIDAILLALVMFLLWRWNRFLAGLLVAVFLTVDIAFFTANITKITQGGWFPLAIGLVAFILLTTWKTGRKILLARLVNDEMPVETFIGAFETVPRVPGTAVFLTGSAEGTPHALLHNLKHNKVLHQRNVLLTVCTEEVPYVPNKDRIELTDFGDGFYRVLLRYGFMQDTDIPKALALCERHGLSFEMMETSFFLNRETLIPSKKPGMAPWREHLFAWMTRNATSAMVFFRLPPNRVVELGTQVEI